MKIFYKQITRRKTITVEGLKETKLARVLTTLDLTFLGIGSTLGVGIYVLAGQVARQTAGPAVILSFLIAAIASVFAGLCYAEFGARVPKAGSAYIYSYYTVGEFIAFLIGWNLILEYIIGSASVTKGLSTYIDSLIGNYISEGLTEVMPMHADFLGDYPDFFAFAVVVLSSICLAFGMKESSLVNNVCTAINLCVVIFVVISGAINADIHNWQIKKSEIPKGVEGGEGGFAPFGFNGIIKGAATCFYGFIGFDCVATTGEEAKTPQRSIPLAITFSLAVIFAAYFSVSTVLTLMWPYYDEDLNAPLTIVFKNIEWTAAMWIVSVGAVFGLFPSLLGSLFPLPRIIYAMANDGLLFRFLGKINERFHSPVIGTLLAGFLTGIMALLFNLSQLVDMMSIGTLLAYTIVAACVLMLRYRKTDEDEQKEDRDNRPLFKRTVTQMFNLNKLQSPTEFSSSLTSWMVLAYCVFCLAAMAFVVFIPEKLENQEAWAIILLAIFLVLVVVLLVAIGLQPKSQKKLFFMVPFVPVIPGVSILVNIYLMLMLDIFTWVRFGIWIVIGIFIYFGYGIRNSNEKILGKVGKSAESIATELTETSQDHVKSF